MHDSSSALKAACALVETATQRGTGYLVAPGLVLTCWHVVAEAATGAVAVTLGTRKQLARIIQTDPAHDCALLALEEPRPDLTPLPLAVAAVPRGAAWESYGFPAAMSRSGILIGGTVQDVHGQDLDERPALVLASSQVTAGAELQGFSGSPVVCDGQVIGQLRQIVPDRNGGAQYGVLFACSAATLRALAPPEVLAPPADGGNRPPQTPAAASGQRARSRSLRWLGLGLGLAAVIGIVTAGTLVPRHSAQAVADLRLRLDTLLAQDGAPGTPAPCQSQDARTLARLVRAAELLAGSGVHSVRPGERQALNQLTDLATEGGGTQTAELQALLARAHLAVDTDSEAALRAAAQAVALCPQLALAHKLVGNAEQLRSHPQAAAVAYRQALALAPGYLAPQFNLGLVLLQLGDHHAAITYLSELLRRSPDYPGAHLARGQALLLSGQAIAAQADLERAASSTPERSEVWLLLGQAHLNRGQATAARAAFCRAKKLGNEEGKVRCPDTPEP